MSEIAKPIGYINFDGIGGDNNEVEIRVPSDRLDELRRGQYVMLQSHSTGQPVLYLARIVRGPFFVPDAVSKDSAYARAAVLQADTVKFRPDFHGVCTAEILGQVADEQSLAVVGTATRPFPQASVRKLSGEQVERLLGVRGDLYLGELSGYEGVRVKLRSEDKRVLPRNLGVFGTVGSGKTNTSQVLIEGASACGWCVIVLDVEGEYVEMDSASKEAGTSPSMAKLMQRFGVEPQGLDPNRFRVMHCINAEPSRSDSTEFGLRFGNVDPYILSEILGLTDAQMEKFLEVWTALKQRPHGGGGRGTRQATGLAGYLSEDDDDAVGSDMQLKDVIAEAGRRGSDEKGTSWPVLLRKLKMLQRTGVFDTGKDLGDYSELLKPSTVTVFDVSGSANVWVNNIVISDILRGLFRAKLADRAESLPRVLVVIEEAHTFVSKQNASKMDMTLDTLRDISRRGRKRWFSLCFISQQPAHLPAEIYELCNTKIVHQTTGGKNMEALRDSAGGVNPAIWQEVPVLGQGRCLVISPQFRHPLLCDVRPCSSNRRFTQ